MEGASEGENNRINNSDSPIEGPRKPKRQMKTPYQLRILEDTYALEAYPSEATRAELSEQLGLSDRQLQMWFCHRRLKDKKDGVPKNPRGSGNGSGKRGSFDSGRDELLAADRVSDHGSGSDSGSRSETGSSQSDDGVTAVRRYHQSPCSALVRIAVACVQEQLGEPLRQDGPILGMEFDELPPGAFGQTTEQEDRSWYTHEGKSFEQSYFAPAKAAMRGIQECLLDDPRIRSDADGRHTTSNFYDSPAEFSSANPPSHSHGNGCRGPRVQGQGSVNLSSQPGRQGPLLSSSGDDPCAAQREYLTKMQMDAQARVLPVTGSRNPDASEREIPNSEYGLLVEKKRKSSEARIGKQVEPQEKRIRKELEKQDMLRRKREEQMRREMEKQERERRKDEARLMREKQRQQERFLREERREIERREKLLQKESQKAERRRQKEELRREKEEAKLKAALEKATARKLAKESMELIEDERLELMELAALSKGFPSIVALDYDTLQNIESFRGLLRSFPPKSVQLKRPFSIQPWTDSDENIGNLLMVWRFCITFADILELWPFTLDEFVQAIHDYDSRLLSEIHIALLKLIIKDIEDVARTPSTGMGTNQYGSANPEGGHPRIVEGAYMWGFDIRNWKKLLNPMTWPEILRQLALSAGFGPQLKKKSTERCLPDNDETKGCEDIVSILRNGSAAENAFAMMQEKGFSLQRRSRHRLTPGTVKFAAYHVLSLEGSKGLTVLELAHKIQKSGLRDLTTSKTPEASISVALSRDPVLFERTAPSTYHVRPPFRKDPTDAEAILSAAREKIKRHETGFLAGENADDVERDEDSEGEGEGEGAEGPEVDDVGTPKVNKNSSSYQDINTCSGNKNENFSDDVAFNLENESDIAGTHVDRFINAAGNNNDSCNLGRGDTEIDESKSGEPWVQGLTEGEYSELSVEERLSALVALVGIANEGICTRAVLEDRLDAATALKKQMWAEVQLHKKRCKEENISRFHCFSFLGNEAEIKQTSATAEGSQSPLATVDSKLNELPLNAAVKKESLVGTDNAQEDLNSLPLERSMVESDATTVHIGSIIQQNACAAERLHLQLKSYVGHRAEEMYVYRSLPLGQDRRRNRYWQFVASASKHDPGSGRIFFESPDGYWMLIDTEEGFDALLASLDTRGIRESHLSIMLQNIEKPFKENVRKNSKCVGVMGKDGSVGNGAAEIDSTPQSSSDDSPSSTLYGSYSNIGEPSSSFRIELGKNETDKKAAVGRYQEFQTWMWKECFNSSILCAMRYGRKRCRPLLGICQFCLNVYIVGNNLCPSCYREFGNSDDNGNVSENIAHCQEKRKVTHKNSDISDFSLPLRIRLLKAFLTIIEVTVPPEALQSSWTENCRNSWGMKLHCSTSAHSLLQILTEFEAVLRRDCLSTNFETTEELLGSSSVSGRDACDSADPRSVPHLPWIPKTSSAVAFRLLELDASTFYLAQQRSELHNSKEVEDFTKPPTRYTVMETVKKAELLQVNQDKAMKVKNSRKLASVHGASRDRQGVRGRTPGRSQKRVVGSSTRDLRDDLPLNQVIWQQGRRTQGQRPGWGRRTIRRRRTEGRVVQEPMLSPLGHVDSPKDAGQSPGEFAGEGWVHNADSSDNVEAVDSDDDGCAVGYKFGKQGTGNSIAMSDEDGDGTDDDNDGSKEVGEESVDANEDTSSGDSDGNENERTDAGNSEDYSE